MGKDETMAKIKVLVKPKSSRQEVKLVDGRLVVSVTAPPAEGKANEMCLALVADWLGMPKSKLLLFSGEHHKEKLIGVVGVSQEEIDKRLRSD